MTDECIDDLLRLSHLRRLWLYDTAITMSGIERLRIMRNLEIKWEPPTNPVNGEEQEDVINSENVCDNPHS